MTETAPDARLYVRLAPVLASSGLVLALACLALEFLSGLGYRWGWWELAVGFMILRWSAWLGLAALVEALTGAVIARRARYSAAYAAGLGGVLLGAIAVGAPAYYGYQGQQSPRINDITTDTVDPPRFVAVVPLRKDARVPVEYGGSKVAAQQKDAYPDIAPAVLEAPPGAAFERALAAARAMGWDIVASAPAELRIEATDTTLFYGFKDDIVIRVTPAGTGSRVDVRSLSRIGRSDLGANARRVRAYLKELKTGNRL